MDTMKKRTVASSGALIVLVVVAIFAIAAATDYAYSQNAYGMIGKYSTINAQRTDGIGAACIQMMQSLNLSPNAIGAMEQMMVGVLSGNYSYMQNMMQGNYSYMQNMMQSN